MDQSIEPGRAAGDAARPWWAEAVIYQIYLRSFQDADGDGIGDLAGVVARLDHLVWLGVDALWLSPFHPSPLLDGGYDVSDFEGVDPRFGDLATVDRLVTEAHGRGLKVIIDFVPNHTSDQHPWFRESRASRHNPKRDWYVWRDGQAGAAPNNWTSMMSGPAWTQDASTGQYFYHAFLPEQPDLNWRNPAVRDAMADVLRFWLARGIDGVRVDAVPHLVEDALFRDDLPEAVDAGGMPVQSGWRHVYTSNRPETLDCIADLRAVVDEFPDRLMIGEAHLPVPLTMRYYGGARPGLHAPFNFALIETTWSADALAAAIDHYLNLLPPGAPPNWVLGNHDEPRVASRLGPGLRGATMLAFTIGGAPVFYNGDELGLTEVTLSDADLRAVPEMRHPEHARKYAPHRTPMPWTGDPGGGFTTGTPWLPLGADNAARNVAAERDDGRSMLTFVRRLIALRTAEPALRVGHYVAMAPRDAAFLYGRQAGDARVLVALNTGDLPVTVPLEVAGSVVLSTALDREGERCDREVRLRAHEGLVIRLGPE